jgi:hypothetical protein
VHFQLKNESPSKWRETSANFLTRGGKNGFKGFGFEFPFVPRRASAGRMEKSTRTCLNPAESRVSFRVLNPPRRRAGLSGTRASSFGYFSATRKKSNYHKKPWIAKTSPGTPPEAEDRD